MKPQGRHGLGWFHSGHAPFPLFVAPPKLAMPVEATGKLKLFRGEFQRFLSFSAAEVGSSPYPSAGFAEKTWASSFGVGFWGQTPPFEAKQKWLRWFEGSVEATFSRGTPLTPLFDGEPKAKRSAILRVQLSRDILQWVPH